MFKSISKEPIETETLVKKILGYHFDSIFSEPVTQKNKTKQVKAWIENTAKDNEAE